MVSMRLVLAVPRPLALRSAHIARLCHPAQRHVLSRAFASDGKLPTAPESGSEEVVGPNMQQQEHVSEEAAKMAKITGGEGPDLTQGTPVQDILKEDKEAQKHAPKVVKEAIQSGQPSPKPQSRPFSTLARRMQSLDVHYSAGVPLPPSMISTLSTPKPSPEVSATQSEDVVSEPELQEPDYMSMTAEEIYKALSATELEDMDSELESEHTSMIAKYEGHKYPLPELPIPSNLHAKHRYDTVVEQATNLIMRHGHKATAQRVISDVLHNLRTASPPIYNVKQPVLPSAPPPSQLPLNPALYLTLAIDSIAPLTRIRNERGAAGGGVALPVPLPTTLRQRRRQAITWIADAASKKPNKGTGKGDFARRIADEIIAVVEGRSALWDRRASLHKVATVARANVGAKNLRRSGVSKKR